MKYQQLLDSIRQSEFSDETKEFMQRAANDIVNTVGYRESADKEKYLDAAILVMTKMAEYVDASLKYKLLLIQQVHDSEAKATRDIRLIAKTLDSYLWQ